MADLEKAALSTSRYWLSWTEKGDDPRPLTAPPNPAILGWWISGTSGFDEDIHSICALVKAASEEEAKSAIRVDWPEADDWRFCSAVDADWLPSDRFLLSPWMIKRLAVAS